MSLRAQSAVHVRNQLVAGFSRTRERIASAHACNCGVLATNAGARPLGTLLIGGKLGLHTRDITARCTRHSPYNGSARSIQALAMKPLWHGNVPIAKNIGIRRIHVLG